jgi:hypothetical protein
MFGSGAYVRVPVQAGANKLTLTTVTPFAMKQKIALISSPFPGEDGPTDLESFTVTKVDKKTNTLTLNGTVKRNYSGPVTIDGTQWNALADAVGVVNATPFEANTSLVTALFASAFVDVVTLTDDPAPYLPYEAIIGGSAANNSEMRFLAQKWSFNEKESNHLHVMGAWQDTDLAHFGVSQAWFGYNFSMMFVRAFQVFAPANPGGANAETTVHELTHLWRVNCQYPNGLGHCADLKRYVGDQKFCTMHSPFQDSACANPGVFCPEFYDGEVMFHYIDADDSEYMTIRAAGEPLSEAGASPCP